MIPFSKIDIPEKVLNECKEILRSGNLTNNKYVEKFEQEVAKIARTKYAIATNSCTTGLHLACQEVFKDCKKIALPDYTWPSTKAAVIENGFMPIWLDVHPDTWVVEKDNIEPVAEQFVDGYLLVDTFGNSTNIITKKPVVVDCAHSFGVPFNREYEAGVYSFAPAKTFTAGEGGVIVTDCLQLYQVLKNKVRWAGRMQEVNACIGLYYLKHTQEILDEKKIIFDYYKQHLPFKFQQIRKSNFNIINAVCKSKEERNFIVNEIRSQMITKIRYTLTSGKKLSVSQSLLDKSFFLPAYWGVDYKKVVEIIKEAIEKWQKSQSLVV